MIHSIIKWSISNRVLVLLASLVILLAGGYAIKRTAVDAIPDLSEVQVIVKTSYMGQSPQVVQDQVTFPLTTTLLSVPKAKTVRGFSFYGDSYIYVIFEEGTDQYWARSRVLEYLGQAQSRLPKNVQPQLGPDASGVGWVYMYALIDKTNQYSLSDLTSLQDWLLRYELQSVGGVSEVATVGGMRRQYQVVADPIRLQAYSVPMSHLQVALSRGNQEVGASVVELAEAEYMVTLSGYVKSIDDIKSIPLGTNIQGTPITVADVADVTMGPAMRRGVAELNGQGEVVGGIVVMRAGENAKQTIDAVKLKLDTLRASLPPGVEVVTVYDRSNLIIESIKTLLDKLVEELAIVALVCALFLMHVRSALVAAITLPMGVLLAFVVMYWQGITANIMSLGGIAIAIGAMTDGAIVMIENYHRHASKAMPTAKDRWSIVAKSASEVGPALFFSLLIITVSFLPIFALEAEEGKMFTPLAYTKTYAMAAAAGLSVTLVPVLIGFLIRGRVTQERHNLVSRMLTSVYRPVLTRLLRWPKTVLLASLIITLIGLYPATKIGSEFMPQIDEGDLMYMPTTYTSISIETARDILQKTDRLIKTVPEVENVFGKVGRADTATDPAPLTMIETFIQLKPKQQWREGMTTDQLKQELESIVKVPGLSNAWVMPIKTRIDMLSTGIKTPLGIKISGPDIEKIQALGIQLEQLLTPLDKVINVYAERAASGRYLRLQIDRNAAARFNLNIADVASSAASAIGGVDVTETIEGQERYSVNLRYPQQYRDSPESLSRLPLVTNSGAIVTLGEIAQIYIEQGPALIKSENARLNSYVLIDISAADIGPFIDKANALIEQQLELPLGYSIEWQGQYQYMQRAEQRMMVVMPLTLVAIICLLYFCFGRLREVLMILVTLPFAMVGGMLLMALFNFNFSVAVSVGFVALAGVAVEIGVLMLVYINQSVYGQSNSNQHDSGSGDTDGELKNRIVEGASQRVRPVIMTASTIILGLLPVLYATGVGSEVMTRITAPMVGGMTSALLLALVVLPVLYYQVHRAAWQK